MVSQFYSRPILSDTGGDGIKVLVVDDEASLRAVIKERLEISGFSVDEAPDGRVALEKIGAANYSVLLTDIRMPEIDGITLLREATRRSPDTAGIVMTGFAELDTAVAALKIGAFDYITKPFNFDVLFVTIRNAIRKKAVERELEDYRLNLENKIREQTDLINSMYVRSIDALIKALEAKDFYTRGHSQRVTMYSVAIGKALGFTPAGLENLRRAATLHDLGKIGVRESLLNKPGHLTDEEFGEFFRHPEAAIRILEPIPFFKPLLPAILHHHERYDGTGYPKGLAGVEIPIESRIMAIADAFDAMTSTRAYRQALPTESANAEIVRCSGSQFDPEIVALFLHVQGHIDIPADIVLPEGLDTRIFEAGASPA